MTRNFRALVVSLVIIGSVAMCAPPSAKASDWGAIPGDRTTAVPGDLRLSRPVLFYPPHLSYTGDSRPPSADAAILPEAIICSYDWSCDEAMAIVYRESRFDPYAYNPYSGCAGWFQIHPLHGYSVEALMDPVFNTRVAYGLWLESGWTPWRVQ